MTLPAKPRDLPHYDFEVRSLLDVYEALQREILVWQPDCQFELGEEYQAQRRSPPFVIWQPTEADLVQTGAEHRRGKDKAFKTDDQNTMALCVGKPVANEKNVSRASFKGTEQLRWAVIWAVQKCIPGTHTFGRPRYERRDSQSGRIDNALTTGLSQAHWATWIPFSVALSLIRPEQRAGTVDRVEVEHEIRYDLAIPLPRT